MNILDLKNKRIEADRQVQHAEKGLADAEQRERIAEQNFFAAPTRANEGACLAAVDQRARAALHVKRAVQLKREADLAQVNIIRSIRTTRFPVTFGNDAARDDWLERCEAQRRQQRTRYSVAPLCGVELPNGTTLREGMAVTLEQFGGHHAIPAARLLADAVESGRVLDKGDPDAYSAA